VSNLLVGYPDDRFAPMFGRVLAAIGRLKTSLASMDALIATAALIDDAPLLTRNVKDFSRVPGLRVVKY
jgi:predicted nucleic acid-binding protein